MFGLMAMGAWGVWTILAKLATRSLAPEVAMAISYVASGALAVGYVVLRVDPTGLPQRGVGIAILAGVFGALGAVWFYSGLSHGRTGIVTTISALYFVVAAVLGILILGESLALRDVAGIGFAMIAVVLLAH